MRVAIVYSHDPVYMSPFISRLVKAYPNDIVALIRTDAKLTETRKSSIVEYMLALLCILGPMVFLKNLLVTVLDKLGVRVNPVESEARRHGIAHRNFSSINDPEAIAFLKSMEIDAAFNQSNEIVRKAALGTPKKCFFNRHGAILPDYRGRLAPFWQLKNKEEYGGVTFHVLDTNIDSGQIIVSRKISISKSETVSGLVGKVFEHSVELFGIVLDRLDCDDWGTGLELNNIKEGRYFSSPRLKDALEFRFGAQG